MPSPDLQTLIGFQKKFFEQGKTISADFRIEQLRKLRKLILAYENDIATALKQDLGKSAFEAYATEIGIVLEEIRLFINNTKRWSKAVKVADPLASFPSRSFILPEPHGVTLIIAPWNYPFQLAIAPLVASVAAGNCSIIKPSEISTHTSKIIEKLINDHFEPEFLRVVNGDASVSQQLLQLPFDMIFFTGSPRVGKLVMKAAAELLVPVVLELGGKSPVLVDETVNIDLAAKRIMWGKSINAGQTCIAPDYVLVHHSVHDKLIDAMQKAVEGMYGKDLKKHPDFPRIINGMNVLRMQQLMQGGKIVSGGETDEAEKYVPLTIITHPNTDSALMQEEIFGPLLPVVSYQTTEEAIAFIRQKPKPLAFYVFTNDRKRLKQILTRVSAGGITVNDTIMHFTNGALPFGGAGYSGIGSYHGKAGFAAFSHLKPVMKRATWLDIPLRYPPFGNKLKLIKAILR